MIVDFSNACLKSSGDEMTDLLCFQIVGIVVPGRECAGADPGSGVSPLLQTLRCGNACKRSSRFSAVATITEADAVEAGKVGGTFSRRYHIVGCD